MFNSTLILVFCCIFSVYLQELPPDNVLPGFRPGASIVPGIIGQPEVNRRKPCPNRRKNNQEESWVPSSDKFAVMQYDVAQPQSQALQIGSMNLDKFGYDCETVEDTPYEVQNRIGTPTYPSIEHKVVKLLKDCVRAKQEDDNGEKGLEPQVLGRPFAVGSRRSMGEPKNDEKSITELNDENNNKEYESKAAPAAAETLPPYSGKLLEERQKPQIATNFASINMEAAASRVCYACSSRTNPSCMEPDNRTTIKYCRAGQQCIKRSYGSGESLTVIRDCAISCEWNGVPGIQFNTCDICQEDLCNGVTMNTYNLAFVIIIAIIKCTF